MSTNRFSNTCVYNIKKKTNEKMSKNVDLQIEKQRMWNKNVEVLHVVIVQQLCFKRI